MTLSLGNSINSNALAAVPLAAVLLGAPMFAVGTKRDAALVFVRT